MALFDDKCRDGVPVYTKVYVCVYMYVCGYVCMADFDEFESKESNTYTHASVRTLRIIEMLLERRIRGYYCVYKILQESFLKLKIRISTINKDRIEEIKSFTRVCIEIVSQIRKLRIIRW